MKENLESGKIFCLCDFCSK